jgi:arylsulfatase A-like enzyme/lysophospholipase L1-like esterase
MKHLLASLLALSSSLLLAAERPNIIFIFSDDHALEAISAYGGRFDKQSPTSNIDRIAKDGMIFRNSFCGNSICGPSRASILTGKHSHLNGFIDNNFSRFDGSQPTFPQMLQNAGYETAIIGKWHLISNPTGFHHWEILPDQGHYYNPDFIQMDGSKKRFEGYVTDIVTDKSIDWLKNRKDKSKPFILMTQHKAPHRSWVPAIRHMDLFDDIDLPEPDSLFDDYSNRIKAVSQQTMEIKKHLWWGNDLLLPGDTTDPRIPGQFPSSEIQRMTPEQKKAFDAAYGEENQKLIDNIAKMSDDDLTRWKYQRYIKNYLRSIRAVDENIGRLLDHLDESGLAENTIVIYSSDQGFYLGEHGWYDKRWMFEQSLAMPFIIRWPGKIKPNSSSNAFIQNIDYAPTFLDIAGAPIPSEMQGTSILTILKNEGNQPENWRDSIYYLYSGEDTHNVAAHDGVRNDRHKLMFFPNSKEWMLFDLEKDPQELKNVADSPEYASTLSEMKKLYTSLRQKYQVTTSTMPQQRWKEKWWKQRWDHKNEEANTPEAKKAKIVFLGDSITQAWEDTGKTAWQKHFAHYNALNWGYSGDRTEHLIWRLQNGYVQRINPEAAVILIGTNNTGHSMSPASETIQGIQRTLDDLAWKWPDTKIILMSVFPRSEKADDPQRKLNDEINEKLKTIADGNRIHLLDINSNFLDEAGSLNKDLLPDLLHLSPPAYDIWAEALSAKFKELGIEP